MSSVITADEAPAALATSPPEPSPWDRLVWPENDLPEAVAAVAVAAGWIASGGPVSLSRRPADPPSSGTLDERGAERLETAAEALGLDVVPVELAYTDLSSAVGRLAPALVRIDLGAASTPHGAEPEGNRRVGYLAIVGADRHRLRVLTPTLGRRQIAASLLRDHLAATASGTWSLVVDTWLEQAQVPRRRQRRAREQLLGLTLAARPVEGIWLLQRDPGERLGELLRASGCWRVALLGLAAAALQVGLATLAWWVLGRATLHGVLAPVWFVTWLLAAGSAVPFQTLGVWASGRLGIDMSTLLKRRLLCGALRIAPDVIRGRGSGGLLAMVSESQAVERAGLDGAFAAFVACVQLVGAATVLGLGAAGILHVGLLVLACAGLAALGWQLSRALRRWTERRFTLSQRFVEAVQGHRTRLVQGDPSTWHEAEDGLVEGYASVLRDMDRSAARLGILPGRGWFILGFVGLIPALLGAAEPAQIGLSILGILQAHRAFEMLGRSLGSLLGAAVAWRSVRPLFDAAERAPSTASPLGAPHHPPRSTGGEQGRDRGCDRGREQTLTRAPVLELRGLCYRHARSERAAVQNCQLGLSEGQRLLIEGVSGSGKSTLARLMTGLHRPSSGLLLIDGLDRASLGEAEWRKRIASAPQFHENHLLSAPLSFNLLMGRNWPPSANDLAAAHDTCRALGLDALVKRMPSGIHQLIGETGWQLSHGERSRVFLARALLQRARIIVLDETFGALDPDTLELCMRAVRERAPTLVVIAHP
jgi:ATP-binding cassette subfamily B protein